MTGALSIQNDDEGLKGWCVSETNKDLNIMWSTHTFVLAQVPTLKLHK